MTSHETSQKPGTWTMSGQLVRTLIHACNDAAILFIVIAMAYYVSAAPAGPITFCFDPIFPEEEHNYMFSAQQNLLLRLVIH